MMFACNVRMTQVIWWKKVQFLEVMFANGNDTFGIDAVSDNTLRSGSGWVSTTDDCEVIPYVHVGRG